MLLVRIEDGSGRTIKCHLGYYIINGNILLAGCYTDAGKIEVLLALCELSQLAGELADCIACHCDRHEPMRPAKLSASVEKYQRTAIGEMSANYLYLYDEGCWAVYGLYIGYMRG